MGVPSAVDAVGEVGLKKRIDWSARIDMVHMDSNWPLAVRVLQAGLAFYGILFLLGLTGSALITVGCAPQISPLGAMLAAIGVSVEIGHVYWLMRNPRNNSIWGWLFFAVAMAGVTLAQVIGAGLHGADLLSVIGYNVLVGIYLGGMRAVTAGGGEALASEPRWIVWVLAIVAWVPWIPVTGVVMVLLSVLRLWGEKDEGKRADGRWWE